LNWILVATSSVSVLAGIGVLATGAHVVAVGGRAILHFIAAPAVVNLAVAVGGLSAALLIVRWKLWPSAVTLAILVGALGLAGLFSSLAFRDDYIGGTCGEFDWGSGHLHAGYPYSWMDGFVCVPPEIRLSDYLAGHAAETGWAPDLPALSVDLLFWGNVAILIAWILGKLLPKLAKPPGR